jgi:hypothetical protein
MNKQSSNHLSQHFLIVSDSTRNKNSVVSQYVVIFFIYCNIAG